MKAVIFDRDGVLNKDRGFLGRADDLEWIAGAKRAIARLKALGVLVIVATNQSGVGRGLFTLEDVDAVHARMQADLAADGGRIDAFYVCPFHPEAVLACFRHADHPDRKPNPGMVQRALADFGLDPTEAVLVGDQPRDIEAAVRAGVRGVLFEGGDLDAFLEQTIGV
ncbi:MAG TPA: HAD family hydrolase [Caulobacteraceae bacterium]|nr:HAD family hydrolase [Caulobacteraceae bacterium]